MCVCVLGDGGGVGVGVGVGVGGGGGGGGVGGGGGGGVGGGGGGGQKWLPFCSHLKALDMTYYSILLLRFFRTRPLFTLKTPSVDVSTL